MVITYSDRDTYVAAHVRPTIKQRLREVAQERKESMSSIVSEAIEAHLKRIDHEENSESRGPEANAD
jgi:predicted transcriptional regulator